MTGYPICETCGVMTDDRFAFAPHVCRVPSACVGLPCSNPSHDHVEQDEAGVERPMVCADCGMPAHYDYGVELYQHDDPDAPDCFLIHDARPVTS